jgi:hypothetical protein
MTLREELEQLPGGKKRIASARLRRGVIKALHESLEFSKLNQSDLAKKLGKTRSAIGQVFNGDGNVEIETVSDYLFEMGVELQLTLIPLDAGYRSVFLGWGTSTLTSSKISSLETTFAEDPKVIPFRQIKIGPIVTLKSGASTPAQRLSA